MSREAKGDDRAGRAGTQARLARWPMGECQDQARSGEPGSDPAQDGQAGLWGWGWGWERGWVEARPGYQPADGPSSVWSMAGQGCCGAGDVSCNLTVAGTDGPRGWNGVLGRAAVSGEPWGQA